MSDIIQIITDIVFTRCVVGFLLLFLHEIEACFNVLFFRKINNCGLREKLGLT